MSNLKSALLMCMFPVTAAFGQDDPNAKLNLSLVFPQQTALVGDIIEVKLMVAAAAGPQRFVVADVPFGWDNTKLQLLGVSLDGSHIGVMPGYSTFPANDYTWCNETIPPADGNGMLYVYGVLGYQWIVTQQPDQMVKFVFRVIDTGTSEVVLFESLPLRKQYPASTVVLGCCFGGNDVTGTLTNATVTVSLPGDFNNDGVVNAADMGALLANWGANSSFAGNPFDLNNDGVVNSQDLAILFNYWG
jgi:hypothetical protein